MDTEPGHRGRADHVTIGSLPRRNPTTDRKGSIRMSTVTLTHDNFEKTVTDSPIVLVDFWAAWCGPCKQIAPILEEIYAEYGDKIEIVKLDTDNNPATTARYGVTGIPTMNLYVGGEVVKTIVGAKPKRLLLRELEQFLG